MSVSHTISEAVITQLDKGERHLTGQFQSMLPNGTGNSSPIYESNDLHESAISPPSLNGSIRHTATQFSLENAAVNPPVPERSLVQTILLIATLTGITLASSISTGLLTIGLPRIATDLQLADNLLLW
jgi:hypothetical protein